MPVETRISLEFGRLVTEIIGDDSYGQANIRTGISQAYLLAMKRGKVPSREVIRKLAAGYIDRNPDMKALLIAAGYEEAEPSPTPEETLDIITLVLNEEEKLDPEDKQRLLESIREKLERLLREKAEGKTQ